MAKILMINDFQIPDPGPPDNHQLFFRRKRIVFKMGLDARKTDLLHVNNKGADKPLQSDLISTFVIHYLESIVIKLAPCKISIFLLVSVAEQAGLNYTWSELQKTCTVFSSRSPINTSLNMVR